MFEGTEKPKVVWQGRCEACIEGFVDSLRKCCRHIAWLNGFAYLDSGFVFFLIPEFLVIKVDTPISAQEREKLVREPRFVTHTTVNAIFRPVIFLTIVSHSSISMGDSPSVINTILRVQERFVSK